MNNIQGLRNIARFPTETYMADPGSLLLALKTARQQKRVHRVIFHSHPGPRGGPVCANPSPSDVRHAKIRSAPAWPGVVQIIVGCAPGAITVVRAFLIDALGQMVTLPDPVPSAAAGNGVTVGECAEPYLSPLF